MQAYQDMVYSTAARLLGNDRHAEDIAQDVFIKAYEHFTQLRSSNAAGGWLKTVTTNLSLNHLTRYRKRWRFFSELLPDSHDDSEPEVDFDSADTLFDDLSAAEREVILNAALNELPDHQRVPLVLYHFEEFSYDEIAQQMQISLAKVKTDILRARLALAKHLQRHHLSTASLNA